MKDQFASLAGRLARRAWQSLPVGERCRTADLMIRSFEAITYHRLAEMGYRPGAIIDVGAFHGGWSRSARAAFGDVPTLMVEAQPQLMPRLEQVTKDAPNWHAINAVLGPRKGDSMTFFEMGTGSSLHPEASDAPRTERTVTIDTLDDVIGHHLPDAAEMFLKIDVQGAELDVLAGGTATLAKASLVQLEVALQRYNSGAPTMLDVIAWMADRGWHPTEVSGFSRPCQQLVQIDLIFANDDSIFRPRSFSFGFT